MLLFSKSSLSCSPNYWVDCRADCNSACTIPCCMVMRLSAHEGCLTWQMVCVQTVLEGALLSKEGALAKLMDVQRPFDVRSPGLMGGELG